MNLINNASYYIKKYTYESNHLKENNMTYFEHCRFSLYLSTKFMSGLYKSIVHSFFPNLFTTSSYDLSNQIKYIIENKKKKEK